MIDNSIHASDTWSGMLPASTTTTPIAPDAERCDVVCVHRCSLPRGHAGTHWCTGEARPYTIDDPSL